MAAFDWTHVEILRGQALGEIGVKWFVNPIDEDGCGIIMSDHRSHPSAVVAALEYGLPIEDRTKDYR